MKKKLKGAYMPFVPVLSAQTGISQNLGSSIIKVSQFFKAF